jgi:cytochrome oxidase Cu insertion factor (SCO1/SenC/PrrC family)
MIPNITRMARPIFALAVVAAWVIGTTPAVAQLPDDPTEVRPLLVGSEAPDAPLTTADGRATTLHAILGDAPAVVVFYRGGW